MAKYLDDNGLLYFWQYVKTILAGKVDVVSGKGLSTEDYTTAEKNKLGGIESGAEANVQADWSEDDTSDDAYIKNKPSIPEAYTSTPSMDGTGSAGSASTWAKGDHVHPTDTSRAPIASPNFTGTPSAPTAAAGTNTTQLATCEFVQSAIGSIQIGTPFQGAVNSQSTIEAADYEKGWYWVVETAGTYVGQTCEIGDFIYAIADKSTSYSASDFAVIQRNLDISSISNAEIDTILAS